MFHFAHNQSSWVNRLVRARSTEKFLLANSIDDGDTRACYPFPCPLFCSFTPLFFSVSRLIRRSSPRDSAFGGRCSVSAFLAPRWFLVPSSSLVPKRQRWWGRRECADDVGHICEGFVRSVLTVLGIERSIYLFPVFFRTCRTTSSIMSTRLYSFLPLLSVHSPSLGPRYTALQDDRYSQLARSTSGRQTERPERGNSMKREWCAAGRQRRRTARTPPLHSREVPRWYSCTVHLDDVRTIW